jgi:hypothetical protein
MVLCIGGCSLVSRQSLSSAHPFAYWTTLLQLLSRGHVVEQHLDIPLAEAGPRSQWASAWATTILCLSLFLRYHSSIVQEVARQFGATGPASMVTSTVILLLILILAAVVGYGFLRLYTLVSHVLTINVFKTRGQRLRLLNVETTLLSLAAPLAGGYAVSLLIPTLGRTIVVLTCIYFVVLLAHGYNTIFHKRRFAGFWLLVGASLVTWFVLGIGALAITVSFAVVAFFALAILRIFVHR